MVGLTAPSWLKVNLINKQKMATVITQFITQKTQTNQQAIQLDAISRGTLSDYISVLRTQ
jgi:predicted XRE-type DNA-binding protein